MNNKQIVFAFGLAVTCSQALLSRANETGHTVIINMVRYEVAVDDKKDAVIRAEDIKTGKVFEEAVIKCRESKNAAVRRVASTQWKDNCLFVIAAVELDGRFSYIGIAFSELNDRQRIALAKQRVGVLFQSDHNFNMIEVDNYEGDTIAALFAKTKLKEGGPTITEGVFYLHGCPESPSPGNLFELSAKQVYSESDVLQKQGFESVTPPLIKKANKSAK